MQVVAYCPLLRQNHEQRRAIEGVPHEHLRGLNRIEYGLDESSHCLKHLECQRSLLQNRAEDLRKWRRIMRVG